MAAGRQSIMGNGRQSVAGNNGGRTFRASSAAQGGTADVSAVS